MSTNDILTDVRSCTEFICKYVDTDLIYIIETWKKCSEMYSDLVIKSYKIKRVLLDAHLLDQFRVMQIKLRKTIKSLKDDQQSILRSLVEQLSQFNNSLKIKADAIKNSISQLDQHEYNQHSISEYVSWTEKIHTSLHYLYLKMNFTVNFMRSSNEYDEANRVKAILNVMTLQEQQIFFIKQAQAHMQRCLM